jgi:hypothetical protein
MSRPHQQARMHSLMALTWYPRRCDTAVWHRQLNKIRVARSVLETVEPNHHVHIRPRFQLCFTWPTSMRQRWPFGDMMKYEDSIMSSSDMPSRVEARAFGNVRKKRAMPIRSSVWARCWPIQTAHHKKKGISRKSFPHMYIPKEVD